MELFPDQRQALELARQANVFILTGGAGTGKSTTVKSILDDLATGGFRFALAAPSGKAAKRLSEVTGKPASTIHRLLEPEKINDGFAFTRGPNKPLEDDLIVLDEVSMVDVSLMARFLEAVKPQTKLILVGDPYQLPSVGPGNVLRDLLESRAFPAVELTIIKRQDEGLIIKNCHRIKNGEDILVDNANAKDFFFLSLKEEEAIQSAIVELVTRKLPEARKLNPFRDIQVISPLREKTLLSCKAVNARLQQALNPNPIIEGCRFKAGDKVIQLKNEYGLGIVNGDLGYVQTIDKAARKIEILFENPDRAITLDPFENDLDLAYCLTVHKSQGSEWPAVVIPVHKSFGSLMMNRNLLYTAVSRAKGLCVMVGQREEIPKIVQRRGQEKRFTGLAGFLNEKES